MLNHPNNNINNMQLVDSRTIGLLAAKRRKFNVEREKELIHKAQTTKCRCKHWTQSNPCFYMTCRHSVQTHYMISLEEEYEHEQNQNQNQNQNQKVHTLQN